MKNLLSSITATLILPLLVIPGHACEDNVTAKISLPASLKHLSVALSSKSAQINGVQYFISENGKWCSQITEQAPNCNLPSVLFVSKAKVTESPEKTTLAAIEFIRLENGDPVLQLHEVKAPLNSQGFREFKSKGSVKGRIYGRQLENGDGDLTWSMTVDFAKFDADPGYGATGENISEGIEIRHEESPTYHRAELHPSLAKALHLKPSWNKDWNVNCVQGLFSYEDDKDDEKDDEKK